MLNILIAKTESSRELFPEVLPYSLNETNNIKQVSDFSKLQFKNLSDIDFILSDIDSLLDKDARLIDQIAEKGLSGRLIIIGSAENFERLSYIICNGIKYYEPDIKKAKDKVLELFELRVQEKEREKSISELINDGTVVKKIRQALEKGDSRLLQKTLVFGNKMLPVSLSLLKEYYALIMRTVFEFAEEKGVRHLEKKDMLSEIFAKTDYEALKECASKKITGIIHLVEVNKKNQNKMVAEYIKDYVDEKYMKQDTNAGNIAEKFGVSASYIGTLFREQEKTTITKYITQLRISRAAELLTGTKLQIQTISKKVGYSDQNYFARIFKKQTGLSPGEYRSNSSH